MSRTKKIVTQKKNDNCKPLTAHNIHTQIAFYVYKN